MELMTERTSKHMELRIDRVSKQYRNKIAVDRFSATLHAGVTGLLGANGAGTGCRCPRSATGASWVICPRSSGAIRSFQAEIFCSILPH